MYGKFAMKTSHVILLIILLLATAFLTFCVTEYWHTRPCLKICFAEINEAKNPETQDAFFGKVVGFYETLIYYQFGIIAVLLVLCFLYTHIISHRQAREIVDDVMQSNDFREMVERKGKSIIIELFNNNPELLKNDKVDEVNRKIKTLTTRISKLEKAIKQLAIVLDNKPSTIRGKTKGGGRWE